MGLLAGIAGALSAVMNNVGALALLMPVALQSAAKAKRAPAVILMPLSFGSILGGLVTPIGHQNNTLILGPGGYHFGDYWRMGLPLEILIFLIGVPMLLWIWPL